MGIELNKDQINASLMMENWWYDSNNQVFEVSGAAGTGKTTLVRYLIERIGLRMDEVLFIAYMGKAATCMQRNGLPAKTMHSAMYKYERCLVRDPETNKIVLDDKGLPKMEMKFILKKSLGDNIRLVVLDEGSTVSEKLAEDLLSFGLPVIVLGDLNQLPPVMGKPYFLQHPDVILRQIMRQAENSPIVYLSQLILHDRGLPLGVYGGSAVIHKDSLNEYNYRKADIVLTCTNRLRSEVNNIFRTQIKKLKRLDIPNRGEHIICRKNNWNKSMDGIYLTNGCTGFVDNVEISSLKDGMINLDFRPDYASTAYKNLKVDFNRLMGKEPNQTNQYDFHNLCNIFEFGYAITVHLSQGSQWDDVLFLAEQTSFPESTRKALMYTAITRAVNNITIAV